jgi:hypothetical protein
MGMLAGLYPGEHAIWDLYTFIRADPEELALHRAAGTLPWWTWEEINGSVLRPLTSLSLWLDWKLWPANSPASHLHNLAWWVAMLAAASRLLFRALPPKVAALALAIMALDHGVSMNVGWVANRAALICASFAFLAIDGQFETRRRGFAGVAPLTVLWLSAALLGGEYGLVAFAYVFAHAWICGQGTLRHRLLPLWPAALPLAAYLFWHVTGNYGTFGEAVYAHPLRAPLAYLEWLGSRLPRALADLLWSLPASPQELVTRPHFRWLGLPDVDGLGWLPEGEWSKNLAEFLRVHTAVAAALVIAFFAVLRRTPDPRGLEDSHVHILRALGLGALLGLLPILVAPADSRTLTVCQLGAAAWLARFMIGSYEGLRSEERSTADYLRMPLLLWLLGVHLIADPAYSARHLRELRKTHQPVVDSLIALGEREGASLAGRDVVVLSTASHTAAVHGGIVLALHGMAATSVRSSSSPPARLS